MSRVRPRGEARHHWFVTMSRLQTPTSHYASVRCYHTKNCAPPPAWQLQIGADSSSRRSRATPDSSRSATFHLELSAPICSYLDLSAPKTRFPNSWSRGLVVPWSRVHLTVRQY